jgi:hypothetical protein
MNTFTGKQLRDIGAAQVSENTCEEWVQTCDGIIMAMAASGVDFTAEDVRGMAGDPPHHPNAMGARFLAASKRNIIVRIGFSNSKRRERHASMLAVYKGARHV